LKVEIGKQGWKISLGGNQIRKRNKISRTSGRTQLGTKDRSPLKKKKVRPAAVTEFKKAGVDGRSSAIFRQAERGNLKMFGVSSKRRKEFSTPKKVEKSVEKLLG